MKIYHYIAASVLLLSVAACSSDDDTSVTPYDTNPDAVRIQPSVSGVIVTRTTPEADASTAFADGDAVMVSRDGTTFYEYDYNGNGWSPVTGTSYLVWNNDETAMALQAYYPTSADMASFTLPQDQSGATGSGTNEIADADYMTFSGTVQKGDNNSAAFTMQRRTARVRVTIDGFGDQYDAGSTCNVKVRSPYTTVSVDYSGTEPVVTGAGNALLVTPLDGEGMATGSTATALVVPSTTEMSDANFMEVTVNDETLYVKGIPAHEAGYSYDYHLTVGKNGIVINSVQVKPWNDPIEVQGGTAEEKTDGPDASTNTIKTSKEGQISSNPDWIAEAIDGGTNLTITGPMNSDDVTAIRNYLKTISGTTIDLDLSEAEITSIAEQAFYGVFIEGTSIDNRVKSLGEVSLPTILTEIGDDAFRDCPSFGVANWEELTSLATIGEGAFWGSGLSGDITLPESITTIGQRAFYETSITSIVVPSNITTIETQMFYRCYSLTNVVFKGNVASLGELVFGACSALEEIDLSACTSMPTYTSNPFADILNDNIAKITLRVKADLVDDFNNDENWGKCKVTAVEQ